MTTSQLSIRQRIWDGAGSKTTSRVMTACRYAAVDRINNKLLPVMVRDLMETVDAVIWFGSGMHLYSGLATTTKAIIGPGCPPDASEEPG